MPAAAAAAVAAAPQPSPPGRVGAFKAEVQHLQELFAMDAIGAGEMAAELAKLKAKYKIGVPS